MRFDHHLEEVTHTASQKVTLIHKKSLLDATGLNTFYIAKISPLMKYAPFTWMSSARCHFNLLDKVHRAQPFISGTQHH